jgi:flagellar biosynthesis protein FlhG
VNLAAALAQSGRRTVLVDTAPHADTAQLLGIDVDRGADLEDVLSGACQIADALRPAPAGISLVAGRWAGARAPDLSTRSIERILVQFDSLHAQADALVVDSGNGVTNWTPRLWQQAELVLLVTTSEEVAVLDTYATIKQGISDVESPDIRILVNQCNDAAQAVEVQSRLAAACRRFLGRSVGRAPRLTRHTNHLSISWEPPLAWEVPSSPFGRSVHQLGRFANDVLSQRQQQAAAGVLRPIAFENGDIVASPPSCHTALREFLSC